MFQTNGKIEAILTPESGEWTQVTMIIHKVKDHCTIHLFSIKNICKEDAYKLLLDPINESQHKKE